MWRFWFWYFNKRKIIRKYFDLRHFVRFDKLDGFVRVYNGTRYWVLFGSEKYDTIYNKIRYLIIQKSGIKFVISHNYARTEVDSYDSLPLEKTLICVML